MAGSLLSMGNLARIAKVVALLLFLLPWVTVSCSPQAMNAAGGPPAGAMTSTGDVVLVKATGLQLATGTATPTNPNPSAASAPPNPFGKPNYPILGGALLILLALAATFLLKGRKAALAAAAGSALAAVILCYAVLLDIPKLVQTTFMGGTAAGGGAPPIDPAELARMIQVKTEIGFWLAILALVAAVVLNVLAM
jgi:hypothetical protein